jgi:hypothetical protein
MFEPGKFDLTGVRKEGSNSEGGSIYREKFGYPLPWGPRFGLGRPARAWGSCRILGRKESSFVVANKYISSIEGLIIIGMCG